MDKRVIFMALTIMLLFGCASSASTISPAKIVSGFVSNAVSALMKWLWSLKSTTKTVTGRPLMKFEGGYNVETVFDGSKLGIEPHSIEVLPNGELLILDADNSNIYRISSSLSLYSRPKLVAGSFEGYTGHVDGKPRDARFNHPKGIAVDDRGNIYVADTTNHAIRKISDAGVTTIAGGKGSRGTGGGHVDGPGEDAKFSNDLDVVYIGSSCSLLVIDRGNQAIREIQLHFDDCAYQYGSSFPLGIAVLFAAGFFGYMLALLQHRVWTIVSSQNAQDPPNAYTKPLKSARPLLIPSQDEQEKQEEGIFGSTRKLFTDTVMDILGGVFPCFRKKQRQNRQQHQPKPSSSWPVQDSFEVPAEDEPPSIEARTPTPRKTYAFMSNDPEKLQLLRQGRTFYNGHTEFQHQNQHQHRSSTPHTFYEQSHENAKEVVFGAVQELDGHATVIIKPVNYGDSSYDHQSFRYRMNSTGYSNGY